MHIILHSFLAFILPRIFLILFYLNLFILFFAQFAYDEQGTLLSVVEELSYLFIAFWKESRISFEPFFACF